LSRVETANQLTKKIFIEKIITYDIVGSSVGLLDEGMKNISSQEKRLNNSFLGEKSESTVRLATASVSGIFLFGSLCSFNFGSAFIKLFQIIEIFGRFYFIPIHYTRVMQDFLGTIFNLSDFITVDKSAIIDQQPEDVRSTYNKLTKASQEKNLLRSMPVFPFCYIGIMIVQTFLRRFVFNKKRRHHIIARAFNHLYDFLFELNFVDFAFYGGYSLMGMANYSVSIAQLTSQVTAIFLLHHCALYLMQLFELAVTSGIDRKGKPKASINCSKRSLIIEGIKARLQNKLQVRLLNPIFVARMLLFQVFTISLSYLPVMSMAGLILLQLISVVHFIFVFSKHNPFDGFVIAFQKVSFEIAISTFFISMSVKKAGFNHVYSEYAIIGLVLVCIVAQMVTIIHNLIRSLKAICRKKTLSIHAKETNKACLPLSLKKQPPKKRDFKITVSKAQDNNYAAFKSLKPVHIEQKARIFSNFELIPFPQRVASKKRSNLRLSFLKMPESRLSMIDNLSSSGPLTGSKRLAEAEIGPLSIRRSLDKFSPFKSRPQNVIWPKESLGVRAALARSAGKKDSRFNMKTKLSIDSNSLTPFKN